MLCGTCKYRNTAGYCQSDKLSEDRGQSDEKKDDMLIYDYTEGGGFWVGARFGCVHYATKKMELRTETGIAD
jgi:hypothetical protein